MPQPGQPVAGYPLPPTGNPVPGRTLPPRRPFSRLAIHAIRPPRPPGAGLTETDIPWHRHRTPSPAPPPGRAR